MADGIEGWDGNRRDDGVAVVEGLDGWIIMGGGDAPAIDRCPCCDKRLPTDRAARLVADAVLPRRNG